MELCLPGDHSQMPYLLNCSDIRGKAALHQFHVNNNYTFCSLCITSSVNNAYITKLLKMISDLWQYKGFSFWFLVDSVMQIERTILSAEVYEDISG